MITTENTKTKTVGNGGTSYPYDFKIWDETQIRVVRSNKVDPLEKDEGVLNTDFTVDSVGESAGGNITCIGDWASDPPGSDEYVTCIRDLDYKQPVDIENQGVPKGNTVEKLVDVVTALILQLKEVTDRTLKVDEVSDTDADSLTLESFAGSAPMDDSGWAGLLLGASPATVQGALDYADAVGARISGSPSPIFTNYPIFTNAPIVPTRASGDSTQYAANTQFVNRGCQVLLDEVTVSGLGECVLEGAFGTLYDRLVIEFLSVRPTNSAQTLRFRVSSDGGSSWINGANYYRSVGHGWLGGMSGEPSQILFQATDNDYFSLITADDAGAFRQSNDGNYKLDGEISMRDHSGQPYILMWYGCLYYHEWSAKDMVELASHGILMAAPTINAYGISYGTGTFGSGTIRLWGMPKGVT